MSKTAIAIFVFSCLVACFLAPCGVQADAWTDGQAAWARHGFHHGEWDCQGRCPEGRKAVVRDHVGPRRSTTPIEARESGFDGAWNVSFSGYCRYAGQSQVVILGHRISGQGLVGTVSSSGVVHTISTVNGVSIIGDGRIYGGSAAGSYRQSDGCSGAWSAYRL